MTRTIIIRGPLGCGKTTIAKRVAAGLRGRYISVDTLLEKRGLDTVEGECIPERNFLEVNADIIREVEKAAGLGKSVVIDGCFYHKRVVEELVGKTGAVVFTLKAPVGTCVERDTRRDGLGEEATRHVYKLVSRFDYGTTMDATRPVEETVENILSAVRKGS